jgi:hypothetical protein
MLLDSVMRGGCNRFVMDGGMRSKLSSSFNRMRKKRNVADGMKRANSETAKIGGSRKQHVQTDIGRF